MNIIVNQNKDLRVTGYDAEIGCDLLDIDFYLSKKLQSTKPVHCSLTGLSLSSLRFGGIAGHILPLFLDISSSCQKS